MTELLNAEFTDVDGTVRTLTRDEVLGYIGLLSGAGNETTTGSSAGPASCWPSTRSSARHFWMTRR